MKILWLTNVALSKVRNNISNNKIQMGGWLDGISSALLKSNDIELFSVFPYNKKIEGKIENISYLSFVREWNDDEQLEFFKATIKSIKPDVIHIFGTEFKHSLNMARGCQSLEVLDKTVVSIQGLCSIYEQHYYADLPHNVVRRFTLRDLLRRDNIVLQRKKFYKRGQNEIETLKIVKNVIGRTDWDKACAMQANHNLVYHYCNETLRDAFYQSQWETDKCERHSIFVSQSSYPIKGFHKMLEAMPLILQEFPDAKVYITGKDLLNLTFKEKLKLSSYQKYIRELIEKHNLQNHIKFLGSLNEQQMCNQYLKSNCFVLCSAIENSPNSLGEAMLLGVPCVASDVGGVKNMLKHNEEGFIYPFNESYMLAHYVCEIFKNKDLAIRFSQNAQLHAMTTHNKDINQKQLLEIYKSLIK